MFYIVVLNRASYIYILASMGRNEKGKMKYSKGSDNFNNKNAPKNKPVHKDNSHKDHNHKDNR